MICDTWKQETRTEDTVQVVTFDDKQLAHTGKTLVQTEGSLFHDLNAIVDHPLFREFSKKYFTSWKSTQVITQLCKMYVDLDQLSVQISNPYEKLTVLQEVILNNLLLEDSEKNLITQYVDPSTRTQLGQHLYKTQSVLKDVADIMEYTPTSEFVKKYFLQWDTSDLVVVLIKLYECFDRFVDWTPEQKFGFCTI